MKDAPTAGAIAAWIHGHAAEVASEPARPPGIESARSWIFSRRPRRVRGLTLDDVLGGNNGIIQGIQANGQIVFHAGGDC